MPILASFSTVSRYIPRYSGEVGHSKIAGNCLINLEARVGIEPTHKGFADLHSLCLNPFCSIKPLKQTSILSGFCPASLLKVGTDHDCHASGSVKSIIGTVHPVLAPRERMKGHNRALCCAPATVQDPQAQPHGKRAQESLATPLRLHLTCSAPNHQVDEVGELCRVFSAPLGGQPFSPEPFIS
jgi:hypothetical protein